MTIAYFSISGLDILGALDDLGSEKKSEIVDWIYSLQVWHFISYLKGTLSTVNTTLNGIVKGWYYLLEKNK